MFRITNGKGFSIDFSNGYKVSVQFGPGNYCEHYDRSIGKDEVACGRAGSRNAEVAVIYNNVLIEPDGLGWGDTVKGRQSPEEVLALLNWAASRTGPP